MQEYPPAPSLTEWMMVMVYTCGEFLRTKLYSQLDVSELFIPVEKCS